MGVQAYRHLIARGELIGVVALVLIGLALIVLTPKKEEAGRVAAAGA
jgi:hypothetical protein